MPATTNQSFGDRKLKHEEEQSKLIKDRGAIFGLFNSNVERHLDIFGHILGLGIGNEFVAVEIVDSIYSKLCLELERINRSREGGLRYSAFNGNIFEVLFANYGVGMLLTPFRYGHLDFCISADGLQGQGFHKFLHSLARWPNLLSPFYLTITTCMRGDRGSADALIDTVIPTTFAQAFHKKNAWNKIDILYKEGYHDKQTMKTALIRFEKEGIYNAERTD